MNNDEASAAFHALPDIKERAKDIFDIFQSLDQWAEYSPTHPQPKVYSGLISSQNTTRISATASCNIPRESLNLAVFAASTGNFFGSVNGKRIGTYPTKDAATEAVSKHISRNCEFLKRRVLMY